MESDLIKEAEITACMTEAELAEESTSGDGSSDLHKHRANMFPGYSFTGDNVDVLITPRHMTQERQRIDHHLYQINAYKHRVSGNQLPNDTPKGCIDKIPFMSLLPNEQDDQHLTKEFSCILGWTWAKYVPALQWFSDYLPKHIDHRYIKELSQKTEKVKLGVWRKNEQRLEDMQEIVKILHTYVPGHNNDEDQDPRLKPVTTLSGGDYLTFERHKKAQELQADGRTPSDRLEGLMPKMEDFHAQAKWQAVIRLFSYVLRTYN